VILEGEYTCPEFEYLADNLWTWTEKVDGTNIRVGYNVGEFVKFGGRTDNASIPAFLLERLHGLFLSTEGTSRLKEVFGDNEAWLYGEGYGARIQKGGGLYKPDGVDFVLFDVRVGNWWLKREDVVDVASKLGIDVVPVIQSGTLASAIEFVRNGFMSPVWPNVRAEGLVVRPTVELFMRNGERIITKIKTKDFADLEKHKQKVLARQGATP
jgi:hypothetical protein